MKKLLILVCGVLFFATSCLSGGATPGSSSATYHGELTVVETDTNETSYFDNDASVSIWIPNITEPKFDFIFNGVRFDYLMPVKLNIEVTGIPFKMTISEDQTKMNYIFEASNIVPKAGGVEYEKYKIGEFKGCVGQQTEITFTMPSKNKIVYFKTNYTAVE